MDDFQTSLDRAEALLFGEVPDILEATAQVLGLLPHDSAQSGGGKFCDHLFFPWRNSPKVSDQAMVGAVGKLVKEDRLVFGGETDLPLFLGKVAVVVVVARHGLD